jgi:hypothetical protein
MKNIIIDGYQFDYIPGFGDCSIYTDQKGLNKLLKICKSDSVPATIPNGDVFKNFSCIVEMISNRVIKDHGKTVAIAKVFLHIKDIH